jgi:hypothetical protein
MFLLSRIVVLLVLALGVLAPATAHASDWTRKHAYALEPASPEVAAHPEWILKDAWGNRLWIGSRYAADIGNPDYRAWWIASTGSADALWIEGAAMERRVTYSWGYNATPRDPRTNRSLTVTTWRRYMADFMVAVRAAQPAVEVVHEVLWMAGDANADVQRQLGAADCIFIPNGFDDVGGHWRRLADFVERRQAAGQGVILGGGDVASALLVDAGALEFPNLPRLGPPAGARRLADDVWRREFADAIVLVNEPGAPQRTVALGPGFEAQTVTLAPGAGAILRRVPAPEPPPAPVGEAPPATAATSEPPMPTTTAQRPSTLTTRGAGARGPRSTRTSAVLSSRRVYGRVRGATGGTVRVTVQRRSGRRWRTVLRANASVSRRGAYERAISRLRRGTYRVSARFLGTGTARPSSSSSKVRSL